MARTGTATHSAHAMKLMIMLLVSLLLATGVEAGYGEKKCKNIKRKWEKYEKKLEKHCSPSPP